LFLNRSLKSTIRSSQSIFQILGGTSVCGLCSGSFSCCLIDSNLGGGHCSGSLSSFLIGEILIGDRFICVNFSLYNGIRSCFSNRSGVLLGSSSIGSLLSGIIENTLSVSGLFLDVSSSNSLNRLRLAENWPDNSGGSVS